MSKTLDQPRWLTKPIHIDDPLEAFKFRVWRSLGIILTALSVVEILVRVAL